MNRPAFAVVLGGLVPIALVALVAGRARGEEPPADAPVKVAEPRDAVASLMRALHANRGSVRVGMTVASADRAAPGAAKLIDQRFLPLKGSWLDKERQMNGTVDWDVDPETSKKVDIIRAVLLTGRFDKKEVGKFIVTVGREIGIAMEPDDEDPDTWFDPAAKGVELWISLGDGIIVVESEALLPK